ncbi:MAG: GlxA family transcriptional regulator [Paracoccus sp. (in: a-proteobacteria)]|uniref:GlxA family transcriptional regulator n=1 Tax=Paracoccus sp. TaxID=267 RepID=UPI0026E0525A|nr:GlxA family transcriptional regulator [Paracoccus sp. (in: a-proteobacteria)]MDO5630789.1 GlxA family transcriptional regulator [Paracoccus sp. (in: a-proteobacteria)]
MGNPVRIGFILTPGYSLMSMTAAVEPLRAANHLAGADLYRPAFFSVGGGFAASTSGGGFPALPLIETHGGAATGALDLVFVVAGGNPMQYHDPALIRGLRSLDRRGISLGGISGGAAILARYGLMRGRRFTLHWAHIDALSEEMPELLIDRALYVIDRDRYSCAGGVAVLDMMCAVIARDHGAGFARSVAEWFIHPRPRTANEPQREAQQPGNAHPALTAAIDLMFSHLADPLSADQIAAQVGLSARQLQRLFIDHLDCPLMQFYREMRLKKADELVQQTALPMLDIALITGFGSAAHFSRAYSAMFGLAPVRRRRMMATRGRMAFDPFRVTE